MGLQTCYIELLKNVAYRMRIVECVKFDAILAFYGGFLTKFNKNALKFKLLIA